MDNQKYRVRQRAFGMNDLQRLTSSSERDIRRFASLVGCHSLDSDYISLPLGRVLDIMVLVTVHDNQLNSSAIFSELPGLRGEATITLGQHFSSWYFEGDEADERAFWPTLWDYPDVIRPRIGALLRVPSTPLARQVRFFSQTDIERLSPTQFGRAGSERVPRCSIDSHDLAARVKSISPNPLFIVQSTKEV